MRRALALVGIAVLGLTGLAGPASADPGAGIHAGMVVISEIAAELDTPGLTGGFVELANIGDADINVSGYEVIACTASVTFSPVVIPFVTFPPGHHWLIGDDNYSGPPPNQRFGPGEVLEQEAGGVVLLTASGAVVDEIVWGPDDPGVHCDAITNAGVTPTGTNSINRGNPWIRAAPSPEAWS